MSTMPIRRARPLLGTFVDIRVDDAEEARALAAIDAAFAEIAAVHRLMSFHAHDSDVARINRDAAREAVTVDSRTHEVIVLAIEFARASAGRFDPTVAAQLVAWNLLPRPCDASLPDPAADWRDIELLADGRLRCKKPLWIDLGGIAKGYAVDRAIERLRDFGITQACVNAGGDLRRIGSGMEPVHIRSPLPPHRPICALLLGEGAVASSGSYFEWSQCSGRGVGPHVDGVTRGAMLPDRAVSVVADRCVVADALTKIVMSDADAARSVLDEWDAEALVHDSRGQQRIVGRAA
ncbi:MAG TPA: FAD:protein FMN transferase [Rhodanobacteraceae bacterium]|nr:FAD:protein FMN transferase [Rhodanobacteraceae bacterium]